MDSRTENLKAELKRLHTETAERVVCRRLDSLVGGPVVPGMTCGRCRHLAPSGACRTFPIPGRPCNEFSTANAHALAEERSDDSQQRVVGATIRKED